MLDDQRDAAFNSLQEQVNRLQNEMAEIKRRLAELEAKGNGPLGILGLPGSGHPQP